MVNQWLYTHLPAVRQLLTRFSYEYVSHVSQDNGLRFCNYGYHSQTPPKTPLQLAEEDAAQRYEARLYHHVATAVAFPWQGKDVLEVSCGRGGGASYIMRRFKPARLVGVDFCQRAIQFCKQHYDLEGLSFCQGDAEVLEFPKHSFDIILNIEASFYYPHIERFFGAVARILRPGGYFLYADMRYEKELAQWQTQLRQTGLHMVYEEDITAHVLEALRLDRQRRVDLVHNHVHRFLRQPFIQFAGVTGGSLSQCSFDGGGRRYKCFVLHKCSEAAPAK